MNVYNVLYTIMLFCLSFSPNRPKDVLKKNYALNSSYSKVEVIYDSLNSNTFELPKLESFSKALEGFYALKNKGLIQKNYLTIIDFSMSSKTKRLWVIDMNENKILFNSLVAHGKNSGDDYANTFSNNNQSNKSSLGFFATAEIYQGHHGLSLKLDGLEKGINDNARKRSVVVHGANYVSDAFVKIHNRLGRSQGCPALPVELSKKIIETIKDKSCLFIYHSSRSYVQSSKLIS